MHHRASSTALLALIAAAAGCALNSPGARAADNGFYLGAGVTKTNVDGFTRSLSLDDERYKIIVGFRPIDSFAVEANYIDLGTASTTAGPLFSAEVKGRAAAVFAVGFIDLPLLDIYGKLGLARWDTTARTSGIALTKVDASGTDLAYGAGVQAHFGSLGARLEYERFDIDNSSGAELITLGVTWTFL